MGANFVLTRSVRTKLASFPIDTRHYPPVPSCPDAHTVQEFLGRGAGKRLEPQPKFARAWGVRTPIDGGEASCNAQRA